MNMHSACVASVLRTYYSWKLVKEPDISYNVIVMGLWTLAEIAIGVIVSCLPVLPRFFQHAGPKVYRAFSVGSKSPPSSSTSIQANPSMTSPTAPAARPRHATRLHKILNETGIDRTHVKGHFTELEEYNANIPHADAMHRLHLIPTRSNCDEESRGYGFPVRDTFHDEKQFDTSFSNI